MPASAFMSERHHLLRLATWIIVPLLCLCAAYATLLRYPTHFFPHVVSLEGMNLRSDTPFDEVKGQEVLADVRKRLLGGPLPSGPRTDTIFICNKPWTRLVFRLACLKAGGLNYQPLTTNVFLSGAIVEENRLIGPSGNTVPGEMTLVYFIAHELGHSLTHEHLGAWSYARLAPWVREGVTDIIARGEVYGREGVCEAFLAECPEMNWPAGAPYLRYNLLLSFLVKEEHRSIDDLLKSPPDQGETERRFRKWLAEHTSPPHPQQVQ